MVVLLVHRAWPVVIPHSDVAAGLYLGLLFMAALGGLGRLQGGLACWGLTWWERRRGQAPGSPQGEALIILLGFTLVWLGTLALLLVIARACLG